MISITCPQGSFRQIPWYVRIVSKLMVKYKLHAPNNNFSVLYEACEKYPNTAEYLIKEEFIKRGILLDSDDMDYIQSMYGRTSI